MYKKIFVYVLLVLVTGLLIYSLSATFNSGKQSPSEPITVIDVEAFETVTTGSTGSGDVEISLTPVVRDNKLSFDLRANTHSVSLSDFDLKQITTLKVKDEEYHPTSVPAFQGHHVSGIIEFDVPEPEQFEVVIDSIPKVTARVFEWGAE